LKSVLSFQAIIWRTLRGALQSYQRRQRQSPELGQIRGATVAWHGKLVQIQERDGATFARIQIDERSDRIIYASCECTTQALAGQYVTTVGYLAGDYQYTSQAQRRITIPAVAARAILLEEESKPYFDLYRKRYGKKEHKNAKLKDTMPNWAHLFAFRRFCFIERIRMPHVHGDATRTAFQTGRQWQLSTGQ
jgi:hypothetical protein